jgi:hypothetical protein
MGTLDIDNNGWNDVLWRHGVENQTRLWLATAKDGFRVMILPALPEGNWRYLGQSDLDGDGTEDMLWYEDSRAHYLAWFIREGQTFLEETLDPGIVEYPLGLIDIDGQGTLLARDLQGNDHVLFLDGSGVLDRMPFLLPETHDPGTQFLLASAGRTRPATLDGWWYVGPLDPDNDGLGYQLLYHPAKGVLALARFLEGQWWAQVLDTFPNIAEQQELMAPETWLELVPPETDAPLFLLELNLEDGN